MISLSDLVIPPQVKLVLKFAPYVVIALLIFGLLLTRHTLANEKQKLELANTKLLVSNASIATLQQSIADQNAAIQKLSDDSTARVKAGQDALEAAKEHNKSLAVTADRLEASSRSARPTGAPCTSSKALIEAKDQL